MTRYIVIEKKLGVFVGKYEFYAIFAKNEIFGADKVVSFDSKEQAAEFIKEQLNTEEKEFCIEAINYKSKYVPVVEIIKAGLGNHTHRMMENIQMCSESIH